MPVSLNTPPPMLVTLLGKLIDLSCEHPLNASSAIVVTLSPMVNEVKEEQSRNAPYPILVILSGRTIDLSRLHPSNVLENNSFIFPSIVTEVSEEQYLKAAPPIVVTLSGITIETRLSQSSKALLLIPVTENVRSL